LSVPYSRLFLGLIPWYGILIVLGAALAIVLAEREAKRQSLPEDTILDLAIYVLPAGIIGARIYYVLFSWDSFRVNPLSIFYIWEGGLAIYGGLIAGFVTIAVFCRIRKLSLFLILDLLVPGVALAQAIGRWGNYFNQEAYGIPLDAASPFAFFPLAVQIPSSDGLQWHAATFFLESCWNLLVFLFLMIGRRKLFRKQGDVFIWYLLLYGAGRLIIENFRMDSLYLGPSIRVSQLLSECICLFILLVFFIRRIKEGATMTLPAVLLFAVSLFSGTAVLLFCFGLSIFSDFNARDQFFMLSCHSLIILWACCYLYGRSKNREVVYANQ